MSRATVLKACLFAAAVAASQIAAAASITFNDWQHDSGSTAAGYSVVINDDTAGRFSVNYAVDAGYSGKVLGLFFNFSTLFDGGSPYNASNVASFGVIDSCFDTSSCGGPNNLNGGPPSPWDLAFQVGKAGKGPASGSLSFAALGLTLDDLSAVGIRAQSTGPVAGASGSDKAWSVREPSSVDVPEPTTVVLLGLGLAGLGIARRRVAKA